jgi:outer membrane protein TolC
VQLARQQYESNRRQSDQGVLAPVDVVAAQTQVATFQQNLLQAQQTLTQAENALKTMMLPNRDDLMWTAALIPDTPFDPTTAIPSFDDAVKQALAGRPELEDNTISMAINQLDLKLAREGTHPRVDAFANVTSAGLAGTVVPLVGSPLSAFFPGGLGQVPGILNGGYGQSLSNVFLGRFPTVQAGVQVSLPLRNRTAESQVAITAAESRKIEAVQKQLGMLVEAEVRNSLQGVNATRARLEAAGIARRSAEEQYASEQRQFQAGTSSVFLVLQRQTDLITARNREARALADAAEANAALERATAATIPARGITVK